MRAVTMSTFGGPEVMSVQTVADPPPPGPGEVTLDVVATAVNRADLLQRQGFYAPPPGASQILGLECSGRVAAVGPEVVGLEVGDEVCALLSGGGYATRVTVPAGQVLPVPAGVSLVEAAGLPEVAATVHSTVFGVAGLRDGEVFCVHGGASGIGTFAIQAVRALRPACVVATTAGSPAKLERVRALGAHLAVSYRDEDFVEVIRAATDGHGADVILDNMGAAYLPRNVALLATGGRLVVIGLQGGVKGELNLSVLLGKRAAVHAASLRARPAGEKAAIVAAVRAEVWPAVESGGIRPVIDRVLPLAEVVEAHQLLADLGHVGKVILTMPTS
ncbi:NAD(P)H-quinone oxidoreductase [Candidatus Frankia nodulisporulans]|uniref:NAD(P)H-quinone oxidoreductase n=1 Tax=Candidatus Frankia nodulisporulans TaxID=2060052 RepID=UPI0013D603E1|nr:NAD(P)H-quinone oxidoreductase [Candidatus Frankia nodulisporulans]